MLGYHKCMAPSRIQSLVSMTSMTYGQFLCRVPLNPPEVTSGFGLSVGKKPSMALEIIQFQVRMNAKGSFSHKLHYPFGMAGNYTLHFCFGIISANSFSKKNLGPFVNKKSSLKIPAIIP